jgi:hypothetical protein
MSVDIHLADEEQGQLKPGARGTCVGCGEPLIAKCGEINRWHWAHEASDSTCTSTDGEGAWHLAWKHWAQRHGARTEITRGQHRADIIWPDGTIYELQSSYLSAIDIKRREDHWGEQLVWIYRMTPGRFGRLGNAGDGWFKWKHPAPSMARHQRPVLWHVNDRIYDTTIEFAGDDVRVKFTPGERDRYGPVLYGSRPAPFDLNDSRTAERRLRPPTPAQEAS